MDGWMDGFMEVLVNIEGKSRRRKLSSLKKDLISYFLS